MRFHDQAAWIRLSPPGRCVERMSEPFISAEALLSYTRDVIALVVSGEASVGLTPPIGFEEREHGGVFVTLYLSGKLRGCIGCLDSKLSLAEALRHAATDTARHDPRFGPVTPNELNDVRIQVSILCDPRKTDDPLSLELGRHGILIRRDGRQGLFLPQVAVDHRLDREAFLSRCCTEKAGLPADAWRDPATEVLLFTTEVIAESD